MADSAHLEKMGRELKCPICLSLLNSAVSLTCNHVFCNLCISKSMKSASSCPVCKVPYRRREVRPAPHMDNLVSIYKSMEVASGINIFVTQPAPSIRKADGQQGGSCVSERPTDKTSQGKSSKQTRCKQKGSNESEKSKELDSHASVKPSFPAKKRIQVPLSPPGSSETPVQAKKMRKLGNQDFKERELEKNAEKSSSIILKEKPDFNREGNPVFTPFFWLREMEEEDDAAEKRLSQQTDVDWVSEMPRRNTPSFSDLLDSDDESSEKMNTSGNSEKRSVFDSEMFEWTQRALSPELCCTPVKKKIADEFGVEGVVENRSDRTKGIGKRYSNEKISSPEDVNEGTLDLSCQKIKNVKTRNSEEKTRKNGIKPKTQVQKKFSRELKRLKSSTNQTDGALTGTLHEEVPTSSCQVPVEETLEEGFEHVTENHVRMEISRLSCPRIENGRTQSLGKKCGNNGKKIKSQVQKKALRELRKLKKSTDETNKTVPETVLEKVPTRSCQIPAEETLEKESENVTKNSMNMEIPHLASRKNENGRTERSSKKSRMNDKITNSRVLKKPSTAFKLQGSIKRTSNAVAGKVLEEVQTNSLKFEKSKNTTVSENKNNLDGGSSVRTVEILPASAKGFMLHNCENVLNQIRCAFCRSSTDSEASGQMLHYFGGKPVAADYNGGSNIIHSHKSCAEWAPNVYFEDETAKNLTAEIVRSSKIKCCSCGIKGASLGCFEKSCRKSFHVPCAKLIPQCRWDDGNFVMLCPVHSSSKLPKEIYGSEKQSRKRSSPKIIRESKSQVAVELCLNASKTWKWPSGSPSKWVLCCSALSIAEKDVVTEFTRLAGIPLSKTWIPSVTHVIASTDENGACRRTLKVLMGILEGKWILNIDWIKECKRKMEPVDEEKYEIRADIHGVHGGPRNGRIRITEMKPKLFNGFKFYFMGDFVASYKGYLHDLVVAAGGTVLQRKPIAGETFIIYSLELPEKCDFSKKAEILDRRHVEARMLASATGAKVASNTWILDSIAACELQTLH